jgi:hypothetical protein
MSGVSDLTCGDACSSDNRLHFGLGPAQVIDRIEVTWPSGRRDDYQGLAADAGYHLREGDAAPRPLAGFAHSSIPK